MIKHIYFLDIKIQKMSNLECNFKMSPRRAKNGQEKNVVGKGD